MAFDPKIKMSIQDALGNYYVAQKNNDASWSVTTTVTLSYLNSLPRDWQDIAVQWERDMSYLGIFRSESANGSFGFSNDGRAILQFISRTQGIQGYATLNIYVCNAAGGSITYDVFYSSQLDFSSYSDDVQEMILSMDTLDSNLYRDLQAYGQTQYNVPMWKSDRTGGWILNTETSSDGIISVLHDGIKVLYNSTWTGQSPFQILPDAGSGGIIAIGGFNNGARGGGGVHTIPQMQQYATVQNNGATTYIGNTLLQQLLVQLNQNNSVNGGTPGEADFAGANNSRPFNNSNCLLKNLLQTSTGTITMTVNIVAPNLAVDCVTTNPCDLIFALFEIDDTDNPIIVSSRYTYTNLYSIPLDHTGGASYGDININTTVTLKYNKAYMLCLLCDDPSAAFPVAPSSGILALTADSFQVSFLSSYDNGASGVPIPAPSYPPSVALAYRLNELGTKLVSYLPTRTTDSNGFPIVASRPYNFVSSYLSDPSATLQGDARPYQVAWSSAYNLHNLEGQSYVTVALSQLFNFCKKTFGCGAYILNNTFHIERLSTIFDNTTMILDLGYDVAELKIEKVTEGLGANLKLGYTAADLNSNFGTDSFNSELYFDTPLSTVPGVMDYEDDDVVVDQYAIELIRQQRTSQPIGSSINPANPSTDNSSIILYCQPTHAPFVLPDVPAYPASCQIYDPSNNPALLREPYQLTMRDGIIYPGIACAQATDPTAATNPYIAGLYYPDRAMNVELSPCRALQRDTGALLHSVLDLLDSESLAFRNVYVMQYNNTTLGVTGIQSNLQVGAGASPVVEFSDKSIAALPPQLFKPIKIKVKSKYPVNLYQTLNTNPNGYVRFFWREEGYAATEYKFFITKATQMAATGQATEFEGWATPDMVI